VPGKRLKVDGGLILVIRAIMTIAVSQKLGFWTIDLIGEDIAVRVLHNAYDAVGPMVEQIGKVEISGDDRA
jgi:hypothetical protein